MKKYLKTYAFWQILDLSIVGFVVLVDTLFGNRIEYVPLAIGYTVIHAISTTYLEMGESKKNGWFRCM